MQIARFQQKENAAAYGKLPRDTSSCWNSNRPVLFPHLVLRPDTLHPLLKPSASEPAKVWLNHCLQFARPQDKTRQSLRAMLGRHCCHVFHTAGIDAQIRRHSVNDFLRVLLMLAPGRLDEIFLSSAIDRAANAFAMAMNCSDGRFCKLTGDCQIAKGRCSAKSCRRTRRSQIKGPDDLRTSAFTFLRECASHRKDTSAPDQKPSSSGISLSSCRASP